jgi:hypothetical protein
MDDDRTALHLLIRGFQVSRILRLVADLRLADRIDKTGGTNISGLAVACGAEAPQLLRVFRALASFGIFRLEGESVLHTPRSLLLRTDAPSSLHYAARFWTAPGSWKAWGELDSALRGESPHRAAWGVDRFDYLRQHPVEARVFDDFMAHFPDDRHNAVAAAYDFSGAKLIIDIGGGNGEALRCILRRFEQVRGLVFDRTDVVAAIPEDARMNGRIDTEAGNFFGAVPAGGDIYLLVRVLHDWSDEDCLKILTRCRQAMSLQSRLLVVEQLLDPNPSTADPLSYLLDMQMMAMFGAARERTRDEFSTLLNTAGFELRTTLKTKSPVSIMEGIPY